MADEDTLNEATDAGKAAEADEAAEATEAEVARPIEEAAADEPAGGRVLTRRFQVAVAAATVAFIAAVVLGVLWYMETNTSEYQVGTGRADVEAAASNGVRAYTEIDYERPDAFRESQKAISTDSLYEQMGKGWSTYRKTIVSSQLKVDVDILDIGVQRIDTHKGDAVALAAVKITRSAKGMEEQSGMLRIITQLKRVGDDWKIVDVTNAPEYQKS